MNLQLCNQVTFQSRFWRWTKILSNCWCKACEDTIVHLQCVNLWLFAGNSEKRDTENTKLGARWTTHDRDASKTMQILVCQERPSGLYTGVCKDTYFLTCLWNYSLSLFHTLFIQTENESNSFGLFLFRFRNYIMKRELGWTTQLTNILWKHVWLKKYSAFFWMTQY